jgi:hypothetical protein
MWWVGIAEEGKGSYVVTKADRSRVRGRYREMFTHRS